MTHEAHYIIFLTKDVIQGLKEDYNSNEEIYNEAERKISESAEAFKAQSEKKILEAENKKLENELDEIRKRKNKLIATEWVSIMLPDLSNVMAEMYKSAVESGEHPRPIDLESFKKTIEEKVCQLCGQDVNENILEDLSDFIKTIKDHSPYMRDIDRLYEDSLDLKNYVTSLPELFVSLKSVS